MDLGVVTGDILVLANHIHHLLLSVAKGKSDLVLKMMIMMVHFPFWKRSKRYQEVSEAEFMCPFSDYLFIFWFRDFGSAAVSKHPVSLKRDKQYHNNPQGTMWVCYLEFFFFCRYEYVILITCICTD